MNTRIIWLKAQGRDAVPIPRLATRGFRDRRPRPTHEGHGRGRSSATLGGAMGRTQRVEAERSRMLGRGPPIRAIGSRGRRAAAGLEE